MQKLLPVLLLVAISWIVEALDQWLLLGLDRFGVQPRTVEGLIGVPLMPFLHGGWDHLIANTVPLLVLGAIATIGQRSFAAVTIPLVLLTGLGTWLIATSGVHIGASGLIFGYFGYTVARGVYAGHLGLLLLAAIVIVLYGGIIWGVLPSRAEVSWEGHLAGLLSGLLVGRTAGREDKAERRR